MGIYVLGIFTRRTNAIGAATGALSSVVTTLLIKNYTDFHWVGYMPAAVFACVTIGYVVSVLTPASSKDLDGLNIFQMRRDLAGEYDDAAPEESGTAK